ncbi:AAA family ATPase [Aquaspirillum serpens]|uniref:AAA family ATPase n=1 Tax=Aquaspirillum serpens TaxID=190 RepID=UPI0009DB9BCF|nr:AAA family ATPase [Aquaspirillum serpens]
MKKRHLDELTKGIFKNITKPFIDNIDISRSRTHELSELHYFSEIKKLISQISGGEFIEEEDVRFKPTGTDIYLDFSMVSSSTKSIYLIEKIIKHELKPGSIIIIDEPELNLHLDNQVLMARLLATLVNSEITVVITTHSDHMLREINNLIMLGSGNIEEEDQQELMSEFDIDKSCLLTSEQVSAYVVSSREKKVFPAV